MGDLERDVGRCVREKRKAKVSPPYPIASKVAKHFLTRASQSGICSRVGFQQRHLKCDLMRVFFCVEAVSGGYSRSSRSREDRERLETGDGKDIGGR